MEQAKLKESISNQKDVALEEMVVSTAKESQELSKAKTLEKHEQLCELNRVLAVLASASVRTDCNNTFYAYLTFDASYSDSRLSLLLLFQSVN